ncbi:M949_RS01915 family surface polysaccharide biosynthesis protein [Pseudomonas kitaguniensis]|uniref:M949_RS01915 family surface polysaccharide biosynthesis protein n=1 Tax=Pseudomonas kitaguniensis TaxID=2607908 RepID=UPI003BA1DD04
MNSVQLLRGQLRPALMGLLMAVACVTTVTVRADTEVALTTLDQVPEGVEVRGKQVAAYTWDDRQGKNLLVLAEHVSERDDDGTQSAFVYAAQYLLGGDHPKRVWMLYDDVQHCQFDAALRFDMAATKVTDLGGDGITQATVGYSRTCTSDVSPNEFKLIMHVGKSEKYRLRGVDRVGASWWDEESGALRGMPLPKDCSVAAQQALVSQYKEQGTELPLPGCYADESDFAKAPDTYLAFMRQHWFALMQKQDADWGQAQTQPQPEASIEDDESAP